MLENRGTLSLLQRAAFLAMVLACDSSQAACEFKVPSGWSQANTRWDGDCVAGVADGLGILKEYSGNQVARWFFGSLRNGDVELGVIDQSEGYIAGKFTHGQLLSSPDRQTYLDAFEQAEQAASQAASRFKQVGNQASARFYADKARELAEQMD